MEALAIFSFLVLMPWLEGVELSPTEIHMSGMLSTHEKIIQSVVQYLIFEEKRLAELRRLFKKYQLLYMRASNTSEFLSNAVYSYLLPKRITDDLDEIMEVVYAANETQLIFDDVLENELYPEEEYVKDRAIALLWLQDIYRNSTNPNITKYHQLIEDTSLELSAKDCYDIGYNAYAVTNYPILLYWMTKALDKWDEENTEVQKTDILEHIAIAYIELGDLPASLETYEHLLRIDPSHERALKNLNMVIGKLEGNTGVDRTADNTEDFEEILEVDAENKAYVQKLLRNYKALCSERKQRTVAEQSDLFCRFHTNDHPYLLLQPAKEEELYLKPRVVIYHDVFTDHEMDTMIAVAKPVLKFAEVVREKNETTSTYRISQNAWLSENVSDIVAQVNRRIGDITGLSMKTAENLQIANYGVGGYYKPHHDAFGILFVEEHKNDTESVVANGDRIATWLTYLNDVEAGGSTVFPHFGVSIKPKRGTAAFWYNIHDNRLIDMHTIHASCPLLAGTKWVSNKWIHEHGQELLRPCGLVEPR